MLKKAVLEKEGMRVPKLAFLLLIRNIMAPLPPKILNLPKGNHLVKVEEVILSKVRAGLAEVLPIPLLARKLLPNLVLPKSKT